MTLLPPAYEQVLLTRLSPTGSPGSAIQASWSSNAIVIADQMRWARSIARNVRRAYHFIAGSQEEQDLEAMAYLAIVELAGRFEASKVPLGGDLTGAFRGWAAIEVRCRCQREARRLRNGGTYHTRREKSRKAMVIESLKSGPDLIDPRSLVDEDENEEETNP